MTARKPGGSGRNQWGRSAFRKRCNVDPESRKYYLTFFCVWLNNLTGKIFISLNLNTNYKLLKASFSALLYCCKFSAIFASWIRRSPQNADPDPHHWPQHCCIFSVFSLAARGESVSVTHIFLNVLLYVPFFGKRKGTRPLDELWPFILLLYLWAGDKLLWWPLSAGGNFLPLTCVNTKEI